MALSCSSLCAHLSLARICGFRINSARNSLFSPYVSCQSRLPLGKPNYSTSKVRRGLGRYVSSKLYYVNAKYEVFLKRRFPRFYQLHRTFFEGFKLLFRDAYEVRRIKSKLYSERLHYKDLPYREMETLRQFRRDLIKAIPLVLISIPPFANYLVFVLMYFFPRQVLIPHFWTPQQQVTYRGIYHSLRARHYPSVLRGLEQHHVKDGNLQRSLKDLCVKVQSGASPKMSEVLAVRSLFSGPPLGIKRIHTEQTRLLSRLLFLTPHLPVFLVGRRLNSHALELLHLDRALNRLGPHQLSEGELRQASAHRQHAFRTFRTFYKTRLKLACFLRGLDSDGLGVNQCRAWLSQWLQVSSALKGFE
ncbi:LETM1 domain-containing protein 1 [Eucyclogobius newberryi]|uniref:LETM1 domain-containing protein 1 n=1 Tax=Eucyclogobius newberryi TaxID=166745 RepID=UPI003B5B39DB